MFSQANICMERNKRINVKKYIKTISPVHSHDNQDDTVKYENNRDNAPCILGHLLSWSFRGGFRILKKRGFYLKKVGVKTPLNPLPLDQSMVK